MKKEMNELEAIQLQRCKEVATKAHGGQYRRDGITPYITHPEKVVELVGDDVDMQCAAWLHDVLEDTDWTVDDLREAGINNRTIHAVELLTKNRGVPYKHYLEGLSCTYVALSVKVADMVANLTDSPSEHQIIKYTRGLQQLALY